MDEQIRQIGERIRGLRDALDLSVEDMAEDGSATYRLMC